MESKCISHPICKDPAWKFDLVCKHCALCNNTFLAELPRNELEQILLPIQPVKYTPGTVIYHEGNSENYVYAIRSGLIKQLQYLPNGSFRILRLSCSGDTIGLERFSDDVYEHTAIAVRHTEACRIPIAVLNRIDHNSPWMYEKFMKQWHHESREADKWITEFSTGSIQTRIIRLILFLSDIHPNAEIAQVELLSREDMAAIIGTTIESTSRVIARLKREGLLRAMQKGSHEVYDFEISALKSLLLQ